jgi:hypothetical protein
MRLANQQAGCVQKLDKALRKGQTGGVKITKKKGEPWISVPQDEQPT